MSRVLLCLLAVSVCPCATVRAEGEESLGEVDILRPGANRVFVGAVGLELDQNETLEVEVPESAEIVQVLLYWGHRSDRGDDDIRIGGAEIRGTLVGSSPDIPSSRIPFVFRADITDRNFIGNGVNQVRVSGLAASDGFANGAAIVVLADDPRSPPALVRVFDGCDFAFAGFEDPFHDTTARRVSFDPSETSRQAELIFFVADHLDLGARERRPSSLEVRVDGERDLVIDDPLTGRNGDSWDTVVVPFDIPAASRFVESQFFSGQREDNDNVPSSFYELFAALVLPIDAGETHSISGTVYCDTNGNGRLDGGEPGIAGVTVRATCILNGETIEREDSTNANGAYRIDGIPTGANCTVTVDDGVALDDKEPTESCEPIRDIDEDVIDCDFGFALPPIIGDTVYCDENGDGAQQNGEPGIAGVAVTVEVPAGGGFPGFSTTVTTDADGFYLVPIPNVPFETTIVATVSINPESGGAAGKRLTTPNPQESIPLALGGADLARDFGLEPAVQGDPAVVSGVVFCDTNADGRQQADELGLRGVAVSINCPAGEGFPGLNDNTTTAADGTFRFLIENIPNDVEVICEVEIDPDTGEAAGKMLTTPNPQLTVPLGPGDEDPNRDFGLKPLNGSATLRGIVFCDLDCDGVPDAGEPGIQGVEVVLNCPARDGFPEVNQTTASDPDGNYMFVVDDLPLGGEIRCTVTVRDDGPRTRNKELSTPSSRETPVVANEDVSDLDFGFKPLAAQVGDTVYCDQNGNAVQDPGEPGIEGVMVMINVPAQGAFGGYNNTATTDANGKYLFLVPGLPADAMIVASVSIDPQTGGAVGKTLTTPNPQETVPLGPAVEDLDRDFGLREDEGAIETKVCLEEKTIAAGSCVDVNVLLSTNRPVDGFSVAVRHDARVVRLDSITFDGTVTRANGVDFERSEVFANGGTAGAIMDLTPPFTGNVIPIGDDQPIVVYTYCCLANDAGGAARVSPLEFVDGVFGQPTIDNVVVIDGRSVTPEFCPGSVTCEPTEQPEGPYFLCGSPETDLAGQPQPLVGVPGEVVEVCLYYCSPEDNAQGHAQFDHLQGLTMAISYDCRLECLEETFRIPNDSILAAIEADFVSFACDNDPDDGDGCELIFGVLVDVAPPFDGETLPPTERPLKLACFDMRVSPAVPCDTCLPLRFTDGINGPNKVPVKNVYAAENESFPADFIDCEICIEGEAAFLRGDCNADGTSELADIAASVTYLFLPESYDPPCMDACDLNDDGTLDLSDIIRGLDWMFGQSPPPPSPGPVASGEDPTFDQLGCNVGGCR